MLNGCCILYCSKMRYQDLHQPIYIPSILFQGYTVDFKLLSFKIQLFSLKTKFEYDRRNTIFYIKDLCLFSEKFVMLKALISPICMVFYESRINLKTKCVLSFDLSRSCLLPSEFQFDSTSGKLCRYLLPASILCLNSLLYYPRAL